MRSLTVDEARTLLWDIFQGGPHQTRGLLQALGLVAARDLTTDIPFPPYDRVMMDGYAVRAEDTQTASPKHPRRLRVLGTASAGAAFEGTVEPGTCAKAMTGAPLPRGADAVIKVEDTGGYSDEEAVLHAAVDPGRNVAPRGEDLSAGEVVVPAGTRLEAHHVQALASAGWHEVPVVAPPRAAVLATGDELVPSTQRPGPGQIRESNGACTRAVLATLGIPCDDLGRVGDDRGALAQALQAALSSYEVLVLSGGVSKGEKDLVKDALEACGVRLHFEALHLKPGHPTTFGTHAGGAVFALPGNPVAVFATLHVVFAAGLRKRLGYRTPLPPQEHATLGFETRRRGKRPHLLPVRLLTGAGGGLPRAESTGHHGSGDFVSLARADALAWLTDEHKDFAVGTVVPVTRLPVRWSS